MRVRIYPDSFFSRGYEVCVWRWWWPFWVQPRINTHDTIEEARQYAQELLTGIKPIQEHKESFRFEEVTL